MGLLRNLQISTKLWSLLALLFIFVLADNITNLTQHRQELRSEKELKTRQLVETALSLVQYYYNQSNAGMIDDTQARQLAITAIRAMRYEEREYFWIHDLTMPAPRMVLHPLLPDLEGKILEATLFNRATSFALGLSDHYQASVGKNLFITMNEVVARAGHGFVTYEWPKPYVGGGATEASFPKLSYVKKFAPWGWVVGSGIYIDDLDAIYWRDVRASLQTYLIWLTILAFIAWLLGREIVRPIKQLQEAVQSLRTNPDAPLALPISHNDETGDLARAFAALIDELRKSRSDLATSMQELASIFEVAPVVLAVVTHGRIVRANSTMARMFGLNLADCIGQSPELLFLDKEDFLACRKAIETTLEQDVTGVFTCEMRLNRHAGEAFWANIFARLIHPQNPALGYLIVVEDINERRLAEADLRLSARAISVMSEGVVVTDAEPKIISINPAFTRITGYSAEEVIGKSPSILQSKKHESAFYSLLWTSLLDSGAWAGEIWNKNKSGDTYPEWLSIASLKDNKGDVRNYVAVFSDISERKSAESQIRFLAEHDALTHLPNRVLLSDRLTLAIQKATREGKLLAVLFVDLDRFKNINDSLGHAVGDALLREVSDRITSTVRASDTVSRTGGDEFIVLLPDMEDPNNAARVAEQIRNSLAKPYRIGSHDLVISCSIGISLFPSDGDNPQSLIQSADTAMYHSKENGRNTYHFFMPEMNARVFERMSLEHQLRQALELNQFELHYQPQVSATTGELVGLEALIRWRHPDMGLVSPMKFIPVAEDSGLILPIGAWVLREACRQNVVWQRAGLPKIPIAVNISAIQFRELKFSATVLDALRDSALPAQYLELELTESLMMSNVEQNIACLCKLKEQGIALSIDDFGTGFSSLSYLKRFPIDKLKIDQSFVRDMTHDADDAAIVTAVITLAASMGLKTIAEGVETLDVVHALRAKSCDEIQGYYFGRPQAPADIELTMRQWNAQKSRE